MLLYTLNCSNQYSLLTKRLALFKSPTPLFVQVFNFFARHQCPAGGVFQYQVGSGRVLDKIPGSGSASGQVGVSKNMIGYFQVSCFLSGISGYFGCFRICQVFSGISGFTHIY